MCSGGNEKIPRRRIPSVGIVNIREQHNNSTNTTTMVVPFAPPMVWYLWICPIGLEEPLPKGSGESVLTGFSSNC